MPQSRFGFQGKVEWARGVDQAEPMPQGPAGHLAVLEPAFPRSGCAARMARVGHQQSPCSLQPSWTARRPPRSGWLGWPSRVISWGPAPAPRRPCSKPVGWGVLQAGPRRPERVSRRGRLGDLHLPAVVSAALWPDADRGAMLLRHPVRQARWQGRQTKRRGVMRRAEAGCAAPWDCHDGSHLTKPEAPFSMMAMRVEPA